jgi:hypothetical protein
VKLGHSVISKLHPQIRRIAIALALSALLHVLILWLPRIRLPEYVQQLPELTAKLEPLPNPTTHTAAKPKPKPEYVVQKKIASLPALTSGLAVSPPASAVTETASIAASAPDIADTSTTENEASPPLPLAKQSLFPQHAQLVFSVHSGQDGFYLGEVQHNLDIIKDRYTVKASTRTSGLVRLFKSYNLNQSSYGKVTAQGLQPETFSEEKSDGDNWETLSATFDRDTHIIYFSQGGEAPLTEGAQDSLSILYQLSMLKLNAEFLHFNISDGRKLEDYTLEIVGDDPLLSTALGELHTVHLRKLREPGKPGLDIWLSMEHRLLPVKVQYTDPDGSVAATLSISDIRVADEKQITTQK